ncbi:MULTISPECIES: VOC family protein [Paenibacillus]|jgi:lactoylglutathione lyase|uniref:VOC family protein n=1 Tax=Paenibacillus oceani TaxID=2772510 RepID=A0A927CB27_9BACL|nr:VOC family protein [Paenibacillus oceani]MBD2863393.1 VOC family protein [Paenibacillus oceani]MDF2661470.1 glyoxalase [Paenibacillus sp.]
MAVRKIEHVGIMVSSMEKSIAFYRDIVGFELLGTLDHGNGTVKLAFLATPGAKETELELVEGYNGNLPAEGKVHHIAFTVDDLEAEISRIEKLGVTFIDPDITTLPNGARYRFFYGPDGEWLELFQPAT